MESRQEENRVSPIEQAREALYSPTPSRYERSPLSAPKEASFPHEWQERALPRLPGTTRHVRRASIFLAGTIFFFLGALGIAGYLFYFGGNSVSTDKVTIDVQGPTTIAGGDTVPFAITITNKNPVALEHAILEIGFPDGARSAVNVLAPYPRYVENLGTIASGATVTRSAKAIVFGGAGQALALPVSFSYGTASSNAVFEKKSTYALAISSTPLSISVDTLTELTAGQSMTFGLTVRSNANVPIGNIVLAPTFPFGFSVASSSLPLTNGSFVIGTLAPGASRQIRLSGTLIGQDNDQKVFHFSVGTANSVKDPTLAIAYMTQDAIVKIAEPFITTSLTLGGNTLVNAIMTPNSTQNISVNYQNTLATMITNASISVALAGAAINYDSIRTMNGFYNSVDHTIIFNRDTDSKLASLSPGATGQDSFSFSTLPAGAHSPTITFSTSASGTRIGQANVPEQVTVSAQYQARISTTATFATRTSHMSGPIPPRVEQATVYAVTLSVENKGSTLAGGVATLTLPSYVTYIGQTTGAGAFSYDSTTRVLTWRPNDLPQSGNAEGTFQVSLTPSASQKGSAVQLTGAPTFSGYDRFAGVQISANANPATTDTPSDPGYIPKDAIVQ